MVWIFAGLGWVSFGGELDAGMRILAPVPVAAFTWLAVFLALELMNGLMKIFGSVFILLILFGVGGAGYAALLASEYIVSPGWIVVHEEALQPTIVGLIYAIFPLTLRPDKFKLTGLDGGRT